MFIALTASSNRDLDRRPPSYLAQKKKEPLVQIEGILLEQTYEKVTEHI